MMLPSFWGLSPLGHRVAARVPDSTKVGINSSDPCEHSQNPLDSTTFVSVGRVVSHHHPLSKAGRKVHRSFNLLARGKGSRESDGRRASSVWLHRGEER